MNIPLVVFIILALVYAVLYFYLAYKTGCLKRTVAVSVGLGLGSFALLGLIAPLTGIWLPFNIWTLGSSAAVGLPGVVALVLLRLIFI